MIIISTKAGLDHICYCIFSHSQLITNLLPLQVPRQGGTAIPLGWMGTGATASQGQPRGKPTQYFLATPVCLLVTLAMTFTNLSGAVWFSTDKSFFLLLEERRTSSCIYERSSNECLFLLFNKLAPCRAAFSIKQWIRSLRNMYLVAPHIRQSKK